MGHYWPTSDITSKDASLVGQWCFQTECWQRYDKKLKCQSIKDMEQVLMTDDHEVWVYSCISIPLAS